MMLQLCCQLKWRKAAPRNLCVGWSSKPQTSKFRVSQSASRKGSSLTSKSRSWDQEHIQVSFLVSNRSHRASRCQCQARRVPETRHRPGEASQGRRTSTSFRAGRQWKLRCPWLCSAPSPRPAGGKCAGLRRGAQRQDEEPERPGNSGYCACGRHRHSNIHRGGKGRSVDESLAARSRAGICSSQHSK